MNPTHQVTFYFEGAEQKVFWDRAKLNPKLSIKELAQTWCNDLGAKRFIVEQIN